MTYKIRYSPEARRDLESIWDGVWDASRDYDTADKYVDDLINEISARRKSPKTGIPLYYGNLFTGFYSVNFKSYKAFYRINDTFIEVIRILPAKSDYMIILFDED